MSARSILSLLAVAAGAAALPACNGMPKVTYVPRGQSVEIALAKRPELVRLPPPPPTPAAARTASSGGAGSGLALPVGKTEQVADAFTRGEFSMQTGNDEAAIAAFREVVRVDPKFTQAWSNLAALYERSGQEKLALEAFRKSKAVH